MFVPSVEYGRASKTCIVRFEGKCTRLSSDLTTMPLHIQLLAVARSMRVPFDGHLGAIFAPMLGFSIEARCS